MKKLLILIILSTSLLIGCGNGNSTPPEITSVNPTVGAAGMPVTISGTGFSTIVAENAVSFNGTSAVVTAATSEELKTTVPEDATSGPVSVTVNGQSVQGPAFSVDNRLNFEGDYENEDYEMSVIQISGGTTVLDTALTVTNASEIEIQLVDGSMDEIELDVEEFLEDGLNFVLTSSVVVSVDDDVIVEVSGSAFEFEDIDVTLSSGGDSIPSELSGEGELQEDGNILFSFEYVIIDNTTQLIFSGEVELVKQ